MRVENVQNVHKIVKYVQLKDAKLAHLGIKFI